MSAGPPYNMPPYGQQPPGPNPPPPAGPGYGPVPPQGYVPQQPGPWRPPAAPPRIKTGKWYFVVTILSLGAFVAIPLLHAAATLKRRHVWQRAVPVSALGLIGFLVMGSAPQGASGQNSWQANLGVILALAAAVIGCVMLVPLRREVYDPLRQRSEPVPAGAGQAAIAAVLAERTQRAEARKIAGQDRQMARQLRIGRPDLAGHRYPDGGLVDLNGVDADVIARACGVPLPVAQHIVDTRGRLGGYKTLEEVPVYAELTEGQSSAVIEYGLVLPL